MKAYIAGPMTGIEDFNYPAFNAAAATLRARGWQVENPAENPAPPSREWLDYMRMAVAQLAHCDSVVLLPGWEASKGARVEFTLAAGMGLQILTLDAALSATAEAAA